MPKGLSDEEKDRLRIRTKARYETARHFIENAKRIYRSGGPRDQGEQYRWWPLLEELAQRQPISGTELHKRIMRRKQWTPDSGQASGQAGTTMQNLGIMRKNGHKGWTLTPEGEEILREFL